MTDDCAMFVQKKLSIVSFNCHGYNNGLSYLPVLLDSSDIVLLQEHWLSDSELDKLCFDGFVTHAISGFDNSVLQHGRPSGGCAILYRQCLINSIKQVKTSSYRYCAIKIGLRNCNCLLVNVYLPTDYRSDAANEQLKDTLGELCGLISTVSHDVLVIAGDWNMDTRRPCSFTDIVQSFLTELDLSLADLNYANEVSFTYMGHNGSKSWIDHVAVSSCFLPLVSNVHAIKDGRNLSDHNPLVFYLDLPCTVADHTSSTVLEPTTRAWYRATIDHIDKYQTTVEHMLESLNMMLDDAIITCCDPACTAHQQQLEQVCDQLVKCLKVAGNCSIPGKGPGKRPRIAGWSQFVKPELQASQWWHKLWLEAGSPSAGVLFQLKKHYHRRYKYAVRRVRRRQDQIKRTKLAESLLKDPNRGFWSEVHRHFGNSKATPSPVVDSVTGSDNIANLFANSFKQLYNSTDSSAAEELLDNLNSALTSAEIEHISISPDTIHEAIGKLRHGKIGGDTLASDHILNAPASLHQFLARLFTTLLRHGFMPTALRDATIQPIPKGSKDPSHSANYRGIALASSLSKVLEWSILITWNEFFITSDLQFGFKSGFSTTLCTGVMKSVINRYLNKGSKVYACLIDASKAFDTVDHGILFSKLLERRMPKPIVRLLLQWYKSQKLCVRWLGKSSDHFEVSNGVRQGGVLSPILFTIYLDGLLDSLRTSGRGCYWEDHFSGAFCYADDLTILAPSPDALRKMLALCEQYAQAHGIQFNADKTQLICFRRTAGSDHTRFSLCGHCLPMVDSVVHLGNTLQYDLSDKLDIHLKSMAFIRQANSVLFRFKGCNPETKMKLFNAYCLSLYGCALWRLDAPDIRSLHVSFNNVIRRIWNLPHNCHTSIAHAVGFTKSIYNIIYSRFIRLLSTALSHSSSFIRSVFHESSLVCNSGFIGYNCMFGPSHCKSYSTDHVAVGHLIREIRDTHSVIPHFAQSELDFIVSSASTM